MFMDVAQILGVDLSVATQIIEALISSGTLPPELEPVRQLLLSLINLGLIDTAISL
ncbi:hypothetical protein P4H65_05090 [Paenibacillus chitinolyticus]|uniref:hypothetical protein n=1 Tax=Paenibacillus chitinolyticus TaxID=79263 RepID=UPI002DB67009|nr:hypothetical protein [Paenibacillus chitinolyticus]MEC0245167.1 hypothetical protein [Paenibacillus chitinolyticus]